MGRNPDWHYKIRAKGICYICRRFMADDNPRMTHYECLKLSNNGKTYKKIREIVNGIPRVN